MAEDYCRTYRIPVALLLRIISPFISAVPQEKWRAAILFWRRNDFTISAALTVFFLTAIAQCFRENS
ncbi:hypothetical protein [Pantoea rodasii]|uniref:hypothetical protein n=1 Tax=Pantoea rodasii TaxID=1076549 RepID=UPI0012E02CD2|nr:hypothetical protein [Pantoea rodasii]